ncbi:MAG: hypothetical protein QM820_42575 [Minicystis sp.]
MERTTRWAGMLAGFAAVMLVMGCGSGNESLAATGGSSGTGNVDLMPTGEKKLFFTASGSVFVAGLDGEGAKAISPAADARGIAVDTVTKRVYWSDHHLGTLNRANFDGSGSEVLLSSDANTDRDRLALDHDAGLIFWTTEGVIWSSDLDGKSAKAITGNEHAVGIAVHPGQKKIYFGDDSHDQIKRCNYDGSGVEVVHQGPTDSTNPYGVAVDAKAGKMFWISDGKVMGASLDDTGAKLVGGGAARSIGLDVFAQKVYWCDQSDDTVNWASYDGIGPGVIYQGADSGANPAGIVAVP